MDKLLPGNRHPFTSSIIQLFVKTSPGTVATDDQISAACGAQRERWQPLMSTVTRVLLKEHRIAISRERGVGYRHLDDSAVIGVAHRSIGHIRRTAKKAGLTLTHGVKDYAKLSPTAQVEHNTKLAMIGTIHHLSTASAERQIRGVVEVTNSRIDVGNTLKLLTDK